MPPPLEREIKLRFASPAEARAAVLAAGAAPRRPRRLQRDHLLDTRDRRLWHRRSALRVRIDEGACRITFKGPPLPSAMKLREELETGIDDGLTLLHMLEQIGLQVAFRYEKYREEFTHGDVTVAVDETPLGTFVELEGSAPGIEAVATRLGRTAADYITDSYRTLFLRHQAACGREDGHMIFTGS